MGFIQDVAKRIRNALSSDKEQSPAQFAKGQNTAGSPGGLESFQAYGYNAVSDFLRLEGDLLARYADYENMDEYGEISSAITIFADDATQTDTQINRTIWVTSPDKEIEEDLNYLLQKTLRVDEEIWEIARTLVLYGNDFEELLVTEEGVRGLSFLAPPTVRRVEGTKGELFGFIQDVKGKFNYTTAEFQQILANRTSNAPQTQKSQTPSDDQDKAVAFEDWEVVHFRLRGKHRRCLRGSTKVSTPTGPVEIQNLKPGDVVHTFDGGRVTTTEVVVSCQTGIKPVFAVRTANRTIFATAEHPFLVQVRGPRGPVKYVWRPVYDLVLGDLLAVPECKDEPVVSIELAPGAPEPVFDIQVAHQSHAFIAEGAVVHNSVYGHSVLEAARWIYKRLILLEDSALLYRLERAAERFVFYVDVGSLPPQEALAWVNRVRQQFRKKKFVGPDGKLNLKHDPLSQTEDFWIPVREGSDGVRVENLGAPSWQSVDDINYFLDKLYSTLLIPKAYFSQDDASSRQVLSSQDVRFARSVLRVCRELKNGFSKVCRVHLAAKGIDPSSVEYMLHMTIPSAIFELAQLEVRNARADLASRMGEFASYDWIMSKVFGLNEDEISVLKQQREEDKIRDFVAEARAQAAGTEEFPGFQPGMPASGFAPPPQMPGEDPNQFGQPETEPGAEPAGPTDTQAAPGGESKGKPGNLYSWIRTRPPAATRSRANYPRESTLDEVTAKRLEKKLDQILREDRKLKERFRAIEPLLREIANVKRPRQ